LIFVELTGSVIKCAKFNAEILALKFLLQHPLKSKNMLL